MGAAAGVVVLVAYCVALTSFTRRSDIIGLSEKVSSLRVLEISKFMFAVSIVAVFMPVLLEAGRFSR